MTSKKIGKYRVYLTTFGNMMNHYEIAVKDLTTDDFLIIIPYSAGHSNEARVDYKRMNSQSKVRQYITAKERY